MPVMPGAEPFEFDGSPASTVGVVLCHGFLSTPQSLRPWGEHLAAAGLPVRCPRLPGHGTRWQDLNVTRWEDWYGELERAFDAMLYRTPTVFAMGLSMGAALCLRLAEERSADVAGLVLVNPSLASERGDVKLLPLYYRFIPSVRGIGDDVRKPDAHELAYDRTPLRAMYSLTRLWKVTRADLNKITQPVLVFRSREDHVVEPLSTRLLQDAVPSATFEERLLDNSYHVATLDNDAEQIFTGSVEFVRAHVRGEAPA